MIPWYGWAYLIVLCLIGASRFVLDVRASQVFLAALRLAAIAVLGLGVTLFFRGQDAGVGFGLALAAAIAVQAHKTLADNRVVRQATPVSRVSVLLGDLTLLPAAVLGALAFWTQRNG